MPPNTTRHPAAHIRQDSLPDVIDSHTTLPPSTRHVPTRRWLYLLLGAAALIALQSLALWLILSMPALRVPLLDRLGLRHQWPDQAQTQRTLRHQIIRERDRLLADQKPLEAARINARLAQEAKIRANHALETSLSTMTPANLIPQSRKKSQWNYHNVAADHYCFLWLAAWMLSPDQLPVIQRIFLAEQQLTDDAGLARPADARSGTPSTADHDLRIFGSSEYVKDGLLSLYERTALPAPADRMHALLHAVIQQSQHAPDPASGMALPGTGSEEVGNVLQAAARLAFQRPKAPYANTAATITDAIVQRMLPAANGLPVLRFDYARNTILERRCELRDHGNEVIPGLAEAYALAVHWRSQPEWASRADQWAEPLTTMYERILQHGRNPDGLLIGAFDPLSFEVLDPRPNDNWGYLLCGILLHTQAARIHGLIDPARLGQLESAAADTALAVTRQHGIAWEGQAMDGYADTLESAIYLAHHLPQLRTSLRTWTDQQIELLFDRQRPDGRIEDNYLDGNFIRTALLYADMHANTLRIEPWRPDVAVGYARTHQRWAIVIVSQQPWTGKLIHDGPRATANLMLPADWPRLNSWPEWDPLPIDAVQQASPRPSPTEHGPGWSIDISLPLDGEWTLLGPP